MIPGLTSDTIEFPVSYTLKVIMETSKGDENNINFITEVLIAKNIPFSNWSKKKSGEGKYTSYSVDITVETLIILRLLYTEIKANPDVKFAI